VKNLPDEEDKKTAMMKESRKRKGRLGSEALGANNDPNSKVTLKMISGIKCKTVPTFINMLDDKVTWVKSIMMELGSGPPLRPRSTPSSTPDSVSESERQDWGRDTRSKFEPSRLI
jgi:hypothetical protein